MRKTLHAMLTGALFLIFVALSLPFLVPMDTYKPALESQLSYATGRHILIDSLRLSMLPAPELTATGITLWDRDDGGDELHIRRMRITPDMPRLIFNKELVIRRVHLAGLETDQSFLAGLRAARRSEDTTRDTAPLFLSIEQVSGSSITVRTAAGTMLGPYDMSIVFGTNHVPERIRLARADGRLDVRLTRAAGEAYDLRLRASDWTLPVGPALRFDRLEGTARAVDGALDISSLTTAAYGGRLDGEGRLSWSGDWRLEGELRAERVAMVPIVKVFGGHGFSGDFSGELDLHFRSDTPARLLRSPMVSGMIEIANGVVAMPGRDRPRFSFERLAGRAVVNRLGLVTKEARLEAYGGTVEGDTATSWADGWAVEASLSASSVDTGRLLDGFLERPVLGGTLGAEVDITLHSDRFLGLADNPAVAGRFHLSDGVIYQADLKEASTNLSKEGTTGGQTEFSRLSGQAVLQDGNMALDELRIVSNALKADGRLRIARDRTLSGKLDVGVRKTASLIGIPILVGGTTDEPRLRPTSSAMLGGVVGTSMLGPGVGTAVGIKVGKFFGAIGSAIAGGEDE